MNAYLVIVSCGKSKTWDKYPHVGPTPAREAYTSPVFKSSRRYAEHFAPNAWLVLSARYGFVEPDFRIPENYNVSFYDADAVSTAALRQQVAEKHLATFKTVGVLGSDEYWRRVELAFEGLSVSLRHVNGSVGFPPLFNRLIGDLIAKDTPFREDL